MKDTETKLAFIKARAEGKSYSTITKELGIAKATCTSWEQSLKGDIEAMKRAQTEELYTAYNMKREARIKALGEIVHGLDKAIADKPLEELKEEYLEPVELETDNTLDGLLEQYNQLYKDSKTGKYNPADIKAQLAILDAKRDTLYRISGELTKEEESGLVNMADLFNKEYESKLLRRDA